MVLVLLARNPTDSVTRGLLPAAHRRGHQVRLLTDDPAAHLLAYAQAGVELGYPLPQVDGCAVTDTRAVLAAIGTAPAAVLSNSDHLQTQTALAADYYGLPGKDWRSALRARDKGLMRVALRSQGLDDTPVLRLTAGGSEEIPSELPAELSYPAVLKPAEGVASEDVVMVRDSAELRRRVHAIREHRQDDLLLEGLLVGDLHTLETLGDGRTLRVWGGYRTTVSAAPHFIEERLTWHPALPPDVVDGVLAQLDALGVGFGPCHTEFILTAAGPRIVEINDRLIGDHCDFAMAELLDEPIFDDVIAVHLGEPLRLAPSAKSAGTRHGLVHWVLAEKDGILRSAPAASRSATADPSSAGVGPAAGVGSGVDVDSAEVRSAQARSVAEVRVDYRPMRDPGSRIRVTGTNRDYLGSVQVLGPDRQSVEAALADFLRTERWVIE